MDQAIAVSDMFLSKGVITSTKDRNGTVDVMSASKQNTLNSDFPIIVLIDQHSASASEIFASALKDNKRAVVMGSKSFGKGSVQSLVPLEDTGALKVTVAKYYTPNGNPIHGVGIEPDIKIKYEQLVGRRKLKSILDDDGVKTAFNYLKAHTFIQKTTATELKEID